jgi:hypothetical protein
MLTRVDAGAENMQKLVVAAKQRPAENLTVAPVQCRFNRRCRDHDTRAHWWDRGWVHRLSGESQRGGKNSRKAREPVG